MRLDMASVVRKLEQYDRPHKRAKALDSKCEPGHEPDDRAALDGLGDDFGPLAEALGGGHHSRSLALSRARASQSDGLLSSRMHALSVAQASSAQAY